MTLNGRKAGQVLAGLVCLLAAVPAQASLALLGGPSGATHTGNLVTNGSFETGSLGPGGANTQFWATGTTLTPFAVPPGWSSSGGPNTYAFWGADTPPNRLRFSDNVPDGQVGMYFGNGLTTLDQTPTFHPDRTVTFPLAPNSSKPPPSVLWQSVPTNTNVAPSYNMSFWVSGEGAGDPTNMYLDGIFGFKVTNVLAGDPQLYLTVPSATSVFGISTRYDWTFAPLNPSLPVVLEWTNWGHVSLPGGITTELVLDDVMVNAVPEPASMLLLAGALPLAIVRRSRARRVTGR